MNMYKLTMALTRISPSLSSPLSLLRSNFFSLVHPKAFVPVHFYGQLVQHDDGCALLEKEVTMTTRNAMHSYMYIKQHTEDVTHTYSISMVTTPILGCAQLLTGSP